MPKRKIKTTPGISKSDAELLESLARIFKNQAIECAKAYKANDGTAAETFVLIGIVMDSVCKELMKEANRRDDSWSKN